jgi:hypothetical protein
MSPAFGDMSICPGRSLAGETLAGAAAWPASTRPSTELNSPAYTLRM